MLTKETLQDVENAREMGKEFLHRIEDLLEREPKQQPPSPRATALEKIATQLDEIDATLDQLWS